MNEFHNAAEPLHYDLLPPESVRAPCVGGWTPATGTGVTRVEGEEQANIWQSVTQATPRLSES